MARQFVSYNFVRIHAPLKVTPAMAAGVMDRRCKMRDVVRVLEAWEAADRGVCSGSEAFDKP
jgi:hypothetical protein